MPKIYVFKKPDKGVIAVRVNPALYGEGKIEGTEVDKQPVEEERLMKRLLSEGLTYTEVELADWNALKQSAESRTQIIHEGGKLKLDEKWEQRLMPHHLIRNRRIAKVEEDMQAPNISVGDFFKKMKEIDTMKKSVCHCAPRNKLKNGLCTCGVEEYWMQHALNGLEERVQKGESDKPAVKKLIKDRLKALKK